MNAKNNGNAWQNVIWREWRYCRDKEYADRLFALAADTPAGKPAAKMIIALCLLYGAMIGLIVGLAGTYLSVWNEASVFEHAWIALREFLWIWVGLGLPLILLLWLMLIGMSFVLSSLQDLKKPLSSLWRWAFYLAMGGLLLDSFITNFGNWGTPETLTHIAASTALCLIGGVVAGGIAAALALRFVPVNRVSWLKWLSVCVPQYETNRSVLGWWGFVLLLCILTVELAGSVLWEYGLSGSLPMIVLNGMLAAGLAAGLVFGRTLGLLVGSGGGLLVGLSLGIVCGQICGVVNQPAFGLTFGLLAGVSFGAGAGISAIREARGDAYYSRKWQFQWRGIPSRSDVEESLYHFAGQEWRNALQRLEQIMIEPGTPADLIPRLREPQQADWLERLAVRHALINLSSDAIEPLMRDAAAKSNPASYRKTASWLLKSITADTAARKNPVCARCLLSWQGHKVSLRGYGSLKYYGCRNCKQSREVFECPGGVVAVLDETMKSEWAYSDGVLRINYLARKTLCDFSQVEIRRASDEQVERFAVLVANDTDPLRHSRYKNMPCTFKTDCPLSETTIRMLRKTFGEVREG